MFQEKLDRLEARESLTAFQAIGLGSGSFEKQTAHDLQQEWIRRSSAGQASKAISLATPDEMRTLGIRVIQA